MGAVVACGGGEGGGWRLEVVCECDGKELVVGYGYHQLFLVTLPNQLQLPHPPPPRVPTVQADGGTGGQAREHEQLRCAGSGADRGELRRGGGGGGQGNGG